MKNSILKKEGLFKAIKLMYKLLPILIFIAYPVVIAFLVFNWDLRFVRVIVVPAGTFIAVTIIRIIVNRPRPYEKEKIKPLFPKDTVGKSFPSRHVASAFAIAFAFLYISPYLGIPCIVVATIISVLRPIAGVHYVSDVIFGFLISGFFAGLFFYLI